MTKVSYDFLIDLITKAKAGHLTPERLNTLAESEAAQKFIDLISQGLLNEKEVLELVETYSVPEYVLGNDEIMAREIFGRNFISLRELCIALRGKFQFTDAQAGGFPVIPWSEETLRKEAERGAVLFPTHPLINYGLLMGTFRSELKQQPCIKKPPFENQSLASEINSTPLRFGWHLIRRFKASQAMNNSSYIDQEQIVSAASHIYNRVSALEAMLLCILVFRTQDGKRLFSEEDVWTSNSSMDEFQIAIGHFDSSGLKVCSVNPNAVVGPELLFSRRPEAI